MVQSSSMWARTSGPSPRRLWSRERGRSFPSNRIRRISTRSRATPLTSSRYGAPLLRLTMVATGSSDLKMVFSDNLYGLNNLDGAVVIDVGAHIGSFTSKAVESGARTVISVEPNPENFNALESNTAHFVQVRRTLAALDYGGNRLV